MHGSGLEELFDRYRSAGDLDALAQVFDRTAEQLLKVARHLSRDEAQAEDLVQATFLAAIEHAERFDASRALVPWLTGILTNKAQLARSLAGRTPDPSRMAERAAEDPAHDTEIREFMATLERALDRVPDAYRQVLRIHLAEGKGAEEIAHEVKRPAGTVRVQLHRGLKRLRKYLPAGFALGGAGILFAPRGLAAVRTQVLGRASALAKAGAGVSAIPIAGGALVGKKLVVTAGILVLAAGGWWVARRGSVASSATPVATTAEPSRLESPGTSEPKLAEGATAVPREVAASSTTVANDDPYGALDMEWVWADGMPAARIGVAALPMGEQHVNDHSVFGFTDEQGHLSFERLHEGKVYLDSNRSNASQGLETSVERGRRTKGRFSLTTGRDVRGRVLDKDGNPVSGADVWVARVDRECGSRAACSSADGSYFVRAAKPGWGLFATAERFGSSGFELPEESDRDETSPANLDLHLVGESGVIAGRVHDAEGRAIGEASVTVRCNPISNPKWFKQSGTVRMETPADGTFRFPWLHKGRAEVEVFASGFAVWVRKIVVEEDRTLSLDVQLESGFTVEGTVRTSDGTPLAGASVNQGPLPGSPGYVWRRQLFAKSGEDGRYRLEKIPSGEVELHVVSKTPNAVRRATTKLTGRSGEQLTWDPDLIEYGKIVGRVIDETGGPLVGWSVEVGTFARPEFAPETVRTDAQGRFELRDCADVPFIVAAYPPGEPGRFKRPAEAIAEDVHPGRGEILLTVTAASRASAYLAGKILDDQDKPVDVDQVWANNELTNMSAGASVSKEDGSFRVGPMPSGKWTLSVCPQNRPCLTLDAIWIAPEEQRDLGVIRIRALGSFELVLRREDGEAIQVASATLFRGRYAIPLEPKDPVTLRSDEVYPGTYVLFTMGRNIVSEQRTVEITSGETTRVELRARAGVLRRLEFPAPEGETISQKIRIVIRGADGAVCLDFPGSLSTPPGGTRAAGLFAGFAPGRYTFQATTEGWGASGTFEVVEGGTDPPPIRAPLVRIH